MTMKRKVWPRSPIAIHDNSDVPVAEWEEE